MIIKEKDIRIDDSSCGDVFSIIVAEFLTKITMPATIKQKILKARSCGRIIEGDRAEN